MTSTSQSVNEILLTEKSAKKTLVKALILSALGSLVAVKIYLMIFVLDPTIGIYGFVTTAMVFAAFFVTYTKYKDPARSIFTGPVYDNNNGASVQFSHPFVSVLVPIKNDALNIRKVVEACLSSSYADLEVIVINDGSTDDSGRVIDELHRENPGRVKALHLVQNMGKRKAIREALTKGNPRGEIIVMCDSDSIVEKRSIENLVSVFEDPNVGAATGHARALDAQKNILTKIQDTWYDGQFYIMKGFESSFGTVTCCSGSLSAYRKEAIMPCIEVWCNDTFLGGEFRPGDDRHLTSFVLGGIKQYIDSKRKAWKVVYCDSAVVYSEPPSSIRKFVNQQIRWKKSWVRVFLFNLPFYYKNRSPVAAIYYYTQMFLSLITPIIAVRALFMLPIMGRPIDALAYVSGLLFIGFMYAVAFKVRNPDTGNRWLYRILMTPMSIGMSGLLYYSLLTIRKTSWLTR